MRKRQIKKNLMKGFVKVRYFNREPLRSQIRGNGELGRIEGFTVFQEIKKMR